MAHDIKEGTWCGDTQPHPQHGGCTGIPIVHPDGSEEHLPTLGEQLHSTK